MKTPDRRILRCIAGLLLVWFIGCADATGPKPKTTYILTTVVSPGVAGNPVPGTIEVDSGAVVAYSLTSTPGFDNIMVVLDNMLVSSSGQITMDGPRSLIATADEVQVLSGPDSVLITAIKQAVLQHGPAELSALFEDMFESLLETASDDEDAIRTLSRAIALAVVPERDAEKFVAMTAPSVAAAISPVDLCAGASAASHTCIVYVNGILTDPGLHTLAWRGALLPAAQRRNLTRALGFEVDGFYNPTADFHDHAVATFWICMQLKTSQLRLGLLSAANSFDGCMPVGGLVIGGLRVGDFIEAIRQIINVTMTQHPTLVQPTAVELAQRLMELRDRGQRIILVGHSQGNLMINEALLYLGGVTSGWTNQDMACVGWVAIAPPTPPILPPFLGGPNALIVKGQYNEDILEKVFNVSDRVGPVRVNPVRNELSDTYDGQGWVWSRILNWFGWATGLSLHKIVESYFGTEWIIANALVAQVQGLDSRCPSAPAQTPTINFSASTANFTASAGGPNPPSQNSIQVTNSGTGTLNDLSVGTITYQAGQPTGWMSASLSSTTAPATVTLAAVVGALPAETYTAFVPIASSAPFVTNSPRTITVTFIVAPQGAQHVQQGPKLVATNAIGAALLGRSVSISGDGNTAIIGGSGDSNGDGAAWVWTRSGASWSQGQKLVGSGATGLHPMQGRSVAISADGSTVLVGAFNDLGTWVFVKTGNSWVQQGPKLVPASVPGFGLGAPPNASVALSANGNTAIIGIPSDRPTAIGGIAGVTWVWTRTDGVWTQQGPKLFGSGAIGSLVQQGTAVALSADGNTALVGGPGDNDGAGAAWVWRRTGGTWTQQGLKLVPSGTLGNVRFGSSLSLSADGNTAIIGGVFCEVLPSSNCGAAWIWTRSGGIWSQGPRLLSAGGADAATLQGFAVSISADGSTAVVGGVSGNSQTSTGFIWRNTGGVWAQQGTKLVGSGSVGAGNAQQPGVSTAISADGSTAILGGWNDNNGVGAHWVFVAPSGGAAQRLRLIPTRSKTP
jgi:hypothetical protein